MPDGALAPRDAQGQPVLFHTLDGWEPDQSLVDDAVIAGVPREWFHTKLAELRNTTIGGQRGVRDRSAWVRSQLGRWRGYAEADRAKAKALPKPPRILTKAEKWQD